MELNIGKCGALGLEEDESISLPSGVFPKPETYKYLGLDQDKNGHAWDSYCDRIQASTRALLRFCQGVGTSWPTKSKIAIYKAFIRPKSDYCAPILWHHARSTPGGMKLIGLFTDLHKDALQWIFSTGQKLRCKVLLESLSAIAPPRRRYDELAANFSSHIIRSAEENPIHLALRLHGDWYQSHSLLPLCAQPHPLEAEFIEQDDGNMSFANWIRRNRITWINSQSDAGILPHYIRSRAGISHYDHILRITTLQIAENALLWRQNRAFMNRKCPVCKCVFNRAHIARCHLLPNFVLQVESNRGRIIQDLPASIVQQRLQQEQQQIAQSLNQESLPGYTLMDWLLNRGCWQNFQRAWDMLDNLLSSQSSRNSNNIILE